MTGRDRANVVLRLEAIETDLRAVEAHLGFNIGPLPHANRSDRPQDTRAAYDTESAEKVVRYFAEDILRFGYRF